MVVQKVNTGTWSLALTRMKSTSSLIFCCCCCLLLLRPFSADDFFFLVLLCVLEWWWWWWLGLDVWWCEEVTGGGDKLRVSCVLSRRFNFTTWCGDSLLDADIDVDVDEEPMFKVSFSWGGSYYMLLFLLFEFVSSSLLLFLRNASNALLSFSRQLTHSIFCIKKQQTYNCLSNWLLLCDEDGVCNISEDSSIQRYSIREGLELD